MSHTAQPTVGTAAIAADLVSLAQPIDQFVTMPGNARRGDVDAVARSYAAFGQRKPIVATADGTVIAGNHQLAAAKQLGWDHIAVVRVDDDPATARAYALADNRSQELGGYDQEALAELIAAVEEDGLLEASLYTYDDLDDLLAAVDEAAAVAEAQPVTGPAAPGQHGGYDAVSTVEGDATVGNAVQKSTMEDAASLYTQRTSRVFLAELPNTLYVWFIEELSKIRAEQGVDSNAEAIVKLVEDRSGTKAPSWT